MCHQVEKSDLDSNPHRWDADSCQREIAMIHNVSVQRAYVTFLDIRIGRSSTMNEKDCGQGHTFNTILNSTHCIQSHNLDSMWKLWLYCRHL